MPYRAVALRFTHLLQAQYPDRLVAVVLFGSVARDTATHGSDIDLFVVLRDLPMGRLARRALLEPVFQRWESDSSTPPINAHLKTPDEAMHITPMYLDLACDGEVLFDEKGFFSELKNRVLERMKKSGALRKQCGRFTYWDLKPGAHADDTFDIL